MDNNSADSARLIELARNGDPAARDALFSQHRARLRRMVECVLVKRRRG
jgi:hypothetical protein